MSSIKINIAGLYILLVVVCMNYCFVRTHVIPNAMVTTELLDFPKEVELRNKNESLMTERNNVTSTEEPVTISTKKLTFFKPSLKPDIKLKFSLEERNGQHLTGPVCKKPSTCEPLQTNLCFGYSLPYKQTSVSLMGSSMNQSEAQRQLQLWQGLQSVPRCWSIIRPLLCAIYMPRCENGSVDLPSQELCRITRGPCRIVEIIKEWPSFLKCDNQHFSHHCKNEWREVKFNASSARCSPPLIETDHKLSWISGVEGCGLPCRNPLFTEAEHHHLRSFIIIVGSICLSCCLFAVVTFLIDWKNANKYPALIIFYINACFLIVNIGWMAQFTPGAREDIVCRKDGTLRLREPSSGENLSCVIIFIMVYYFVMAAVIWFVMLTYSWFMSFRHLGKIRDSVEAKTAYFHLVAWSLPLVLTITILALGQIDGDSQSGICFVGSVNVYVRVGFVLLPILIAATIGGIFLIKSLKILIRLKIDSAAIINEKANARINTTIFRIATFLIFVIFLVLITIVCHLYEYLYQDGWLHDFRDYLVCEALRTANPNSDAQQQTCEMRSRPSVHMTQLHVIAIFVCGIVMSSWVWTESTVDTWKRFFRRTCRQHLHKSMKLKKHEVIAKAFAKRQDLQNGQISVSFYSSHDDPLGMNLDLNSVASQEMSSTWAASVPKFLARRGAISRGALRRNSSASEELNIPSGVLDLMGSRRRSVDSQTSLQYIEQERLAYLAQARKQRRLKKREIRRRGHSRILPVQNKRRGSDSSQQSLPEKKYSNTEKNDLTQRPSTGFTGRPPLCELPILAPIRRNSASSNKAAEDLLRMGTSSGEDSPATVLPSKSEERRSKRSNCSSRRKKNSFRCNDINSGDNLSDAIVDAVWGSRSNLVQSSYDQVNPKVALELETVRPISSRVSPAQSKSSRARTPLNNLRQFPLLSRTALDIDGDSDIMETSSS